MTDFTLPEWLTIGTAGTVLSAVLSIIIMFMKISGTNKSLKMNSLSQINLLETMTNKLSDMQLVAQQLTVIKEQTSTVFEKVITFAQDITDDVSAVATFVNECFQESNLSAEKKLKLRVLKQELFSKSRDEFIEKLQEMNKQNAEAVVNASEQIENMKKELDIAKAAIPPKVIKKRRGV